MNVIWIILGVVALGALVRRALRSRDSRNSDLGFVSHQWIAEHRLGQTQDGQR